MIWICLFSAPEHEKVMFHCHLSVHLATAWMAAGVLLKFYTSIYHRSVPGESENLGPLCGFQKQNIFFVKNDCNDFDQI
jgi:hypothetical protein